MDLLAILERIRKKRVLVVGDAILDCYIFGRVRRISPEAPVPVVEVAEETFALGGAANVANNVVSLGGHATVLGVVGKDRSAEKLTEIMTDRGIEFLAVEDKRPTTVKTRVIAHSQQVVRFDQEDTNRLSGRSLKGLISHLGDAVKEHDAVVISDYSKGVITSGVMEAALKAAGRDRKLVVVDPKADHYRLYKGASVITPNLLEASAGSGVAIKDEKTLLRAGGILLRRLGLKAVLITRGEKGMTLFEKGRATHIPTVAREVFDVTGAGDTVVGTFAMACAAGASMREAAAIANHAAGIVVGQVGTATATPAGMKRSFKGWKPDFEEVKV
ncbi:MAG: D-glycero-beta-D-manno-heptose-7-phosphate kinase [Nitrospirota bacterium]|jgi:D-beta-D-heptose 7-phosphate kinase/D-beta-D-heptose 1-phosphate adenosyltransferase